MRLPSREGTELAWRNVIRKVDRPAAKTIQVRIDAQIMDNLRSLPRENLKIEADLFIGPAAIGPRGARPRTMYILMLADKESGFIFGIEPIGVENSLEDMLASVPEKVALLLLETQLIPKQIIVRSDRLRQLLSPMAKLLNLQLTAAVRLPAIDHAKSQLTQFLSK